MVDNGAMIFRWFESLIDVFGKPDTRTPPTGVWRFTCITFARPGRYSE